MRVRLLGAVLGVAVAASLSACSALDSVSASSPEAIEKGVQDNYPTFKFTSVDCPDSLSGKQGTVVTCTAKAENGSTSPVRLTRGEGDKVEFHIAANETVDVEAVERLAVKQISTVVGREDPSVKADCGEAKNIPVDEGTRIDCKVSDNISSLTLVAVAHPTADNVNVTFEMGSLTPTPGTGS